MAAEQGTRDHAVAQQISEAERVVEELRDTLLNFEAHAREQDAVGHADQYEAIAAQLSSARERLQSAHERLINFEVD